MSENRSEFDSKLCLVTGAGQGIGLACAKSLLAQNARVIACDVTQKALDALQQSLPSDQQQRTTLLPFNLADSTAIQNACRKLEQDQLIPDYIVTCAGTLHLESVLDLPLESLNKTLDVNLKGTMLLTQQLAKMLVKHNKQGAIVARRFQCGRYTSREDVCLLHIQSRLAYVDAMFGIRTGRAWHSLQHR